MQSGILQRDTLVETRVNVLMFAYGLYLRSTLTVYRIDKDDKEDMEAWLNYMQS